MGTFFVKPKPEQLKQPEPPQPTKEEIEEQKINSKIQIQKISNNLDENADQFRRRQMKIEAKIELTKKKAKQKLEQGNQKDAKKLLLQVAKMKSHLQRIQLRRRLISSKKDELQTHELNKEVIDVIQTVNQLTKQDLTNQLDQYLISAQQSKAILEQVNERMKQIVQNSEDDAEAEIMLKELQNRVDQQKKAKIDLNPNGRVSVKVNKNNQVKQQKVDINKMLAEL